MMYSTPQAMLVQKYRKICDKQQIAKGTNDEVAIECKNIKFAILILIPILGPTIKWLDALVSKCEDISNPVLVSPRVLPSPQRAIEVL